MHISTASIENNVGIHRIVCIVYGFLFCFCIRRRWLNLHNLNVNVNEVPNIKWRSSFSISTEIGCEYFLDLKRMVHQQQQNGTSATTKWYIHQQQTEAPTTISKKCEINSLSEVKIIRTAQKIVRWIFFDGLCVRAYKLLHVTMEYYSASEYHHLTYTNNR